jgi:hypothetical protein
MGEREDRMLEIVRIRGDKNKVGVPTDRRFLSAEQQTALADCIEQGWLVWLDSERHPAFGWRDLDVYLVTAKGLEAAGAAHA